jgi:hypothetical protein
MADADGNYLLIGWPKSLLPNNQHDGPLNANEYT